MKVCLISEGAYPVVRGGLSELFHLLMKTMKDVEFEVVCLTFEGRDKPVYPQLPNVKSFNIYEIGATPKRPKYKITSKDSHLLGKVFQSIFSGTPIPVRELGNEFKSFHLAPEWLVTKDYWEYSKELYRRDFDNVPLMEYFWNSYGIFLMILNCISAASLIPEADVYHGLSVGFAGMTGAIVKNLRNKPFVITEQGFYLKERENDLARVKASTTFYNLLMYQSNSIVKTSYKYADYIVPPCLYHVEYETKLGMEREKAYVIPNGIDMSRYSQKLNSNGRKPVVGCFARVVPIKGIEILIKAARIVNDISPTDFVVFGEIQDKGYHAECVKLVEDLGLTANFTFTGHIDNVEDCYQNVDIFTLSSYSEGLPMALLEAMASGLPAICTAVGGIPEIISSETGYVVPPERPDLLAEKLSQLIIDKELRHRMGQQAVKIANQNYSAEKMASRFYELYNKLNTAYKKI